MALLDVCGNDYLGENLQRAQGDEKEAAGAADVEGIRLAVKFQ